MIELSSPPQADAPLALRDEWGGRRDPQGELFDFDWETITPVIDPIRVVVVEAMRHIGEPLSATEISHCSDLQHTVGQIAYHIRELAKKGSLVPVATRPRRGATETFYYFYPRKFDPNSRAVPER